jgi:parallel beta-helix repeat protein
MSRKSALVLLLVIVSVSLQYPRFQQNRVEASDGYPVHNLNSGLNYTTIQEAIDANETLDGHTLHIDSGTYPENISIYKSLSLVGFDRDTTIINGLNSESVLNVTANNVKITGFTITNGDDGITLYISSNSTITNNTISNNYQGINLRWSAYNVIVGNVIAHSGRQGIKVLGTLDGQASNKVENNSIQNNPYGIFVSNSFGNVISGNDISNNEYINLELWYSWNSTISNNIISNSGCGIFQHRAVNDTIFDNDIVNNTYCGIQIEEPGDGIKVFHNNFINSSAEISPTYNATWDDGYPSGGNYWSDYNGTDANHDGIGDTPYVIDANNVDHYPLMGMFSEFDWVSLAAPEQRIQTVCDSTISNLVYNGTAIIFNVTKENGTVGFCRIRIPTVLLNVTYRVFVNGTEVTYRLLPFSNETYRYLYFNYTHSTQEVIVIPESPSLLILPPFFMAASLAVTIYKRKQRMVR